MDSAVAVANKALTLLGDKAISNLSEDSDRARAINRVYLPTLEARLREHEWNFAKMRAALVALQDAPAFGYDYMYQLPQDPLCLRVLSTNLDEEDAWEIESYVTDTAQYRVIVTDETDVELAYIALVEDTTLWDALFADAFVTEIASESCYAITRNATLVGELSAKSEKKWAKARSVDGQESRKQKRFLSNSFTKVR